MNSNEGTIVIPGTLPKPWPPDAPTILRNNFDDGYLLIEIGVHDRIRASVYKLLKAGSYYYCALQGETCPIEINDDRPTVVLGVVWVLPNALAIYLNGAVLCSLDASHGVALQSFKVERRPDHLDGTPPPIDFSIKNEKALSRRAGKFGTLQNDPRVKTHLLNSLQAEVAQLCSLLQMIGMGETFHARGLAARLRLLLLRQGQRPLLQAAAAVKGVPLVAYTQRNPLGKLPTTPFSVVCFGDISGVPTAMLKNPIDIDVWLDQTGMYIGDKTIPHEKLIADLGNTIGSHLDINVLPSVVILRSSENLSSEVPIDGLVRYLADLASVVVTLGQSVLDAP
jgi:hypothetical protein